jgi:hypothetical protein
MMETKETTHDLMTERSSSDSSPSSWSMSEPAGRPFTGVAGGDTSGVVSPILLTHNSDRPAVLKDAHLKAKKLQYTKQKIKFVKIKVKKTKISETR